MGDQFQIRPMKDRDQPQVIALWQTAGLTQPHNDPAKDIRFARASPFSEVLVGELAGKLVASVLVGCDGHRGTVYYLSVDPTLQGKRLGQQILCAAENWLRARGVWKLNILIREGNEKVQGFYDALGYEVEPRTAMAKWLDK